MTFRHPKLPEKMTKETLSLSSLPHILKAPIRILDELRRNMIGGKENNFKGFDSEGFFHIIYPDFEKITSSDMENMIRIPRMKDVVIYNMKMSECCYDLYKDEEVVAATTTTMLPNSEKGKKRKEIMSFKPITVECIFHNPVIGSKDENSLYAPDEIDATFRKKIKEDWNRFLTSGGISTECFVSMNKIKENVLHQLTFEVIFQILTRLLTEIIEEETYVTQCESIIHNYKDDEKTGVRFHFLNLKNPPSISGRKLTLIKKEFIHYIKEIHFSLQFQERSVNVDHVSLVILIEESNPSLISQKKHKIARTSSNKTKKGFSPY